MIPQPFKTLAYGTALSALLAGGAMAQQTAPGVDIVNTISLEYSTGAGDNVTLTDPPTVTFKVDRKIDLLLDTLTSPAEVTVTPAIHRHPLRSASTTRAMAHRASSLMLFGLAIWV